MKKRIISRKTISGFIKFLAEEEKSKLTIEKYTRDLYKFSDYMMNKSLKKENVIRYKKYLQEQKYSAKSINSMLAALNSFFEYNKWYELKIKPLKIQQQMFCETNKELSKCEYLRLVKQSKKEKNERLYYILQTLCGTGIRISELKYLTVEAVKEGVAFVSCKNKTRTIFIVRDLRNKLLSYCQKHNIQSGQIFITRSGKAIDRSNIWREMKKLCVDASVSPNKVFPHNLRHLFARVFYSIEKDIAKLADILGHSNITTTRIYIISSGEEHLKKLENMRLII